jgi:hypothetical protein
MQIREPNERLFHEMRFGSQRLPKRAVRSRTTHHYYTVVAGAFAQLPNVLASVFVQKTKGETAELNKVVIATRKEGDI